MYYTKNEPYYSIFILKHIYRVFERQLRLIKTFLVYHEIFSYLNHYNPKFIGQVDCTHTYLRHSDFHRTEHIATTLITFRISSSLLEKKCEACPALPKR